MVTDHCHCVIVIITSLAAAAASLGNCPCRLFFCTKRDFALIAAHWNILHWPFLVLQCYVFVLHIKSVPLLQLRTITCSWRSLCRKFCNVQHHTSFFLIYQAVILCKDNNTCMYSSVTTSFSIVLHSVPIADFAHHPIISATQ